MEHGDSKAQVKGGRSLSAIRANTGCGPVEQVWGILVFLGLCFMLFILGLVKGVEILQWSSTSSCLPHQFAIFGFRLFFISLSFFQIMLELYVRFKNKIFFFGFFLGLWLGWVIFCHVFAELGLHIRALWVFCKWMYRNWEVVTQCAFVNIALIVSWSCLVKNEAWVWNKTAKKRVVQFTCASLILFRVYCGTTISIDHICRAHGCGDWALASPCFLHIPHSCNVWAPCLPPGFWYDFLNQGKTSMFSVGFLEVWFEVSKL